MTPIDTHVSTHRDNELSCLWTSRTDKCVCDHSKKLWILDLGVSMHFTPDWSDFIEYQELTGSACIPVWTASATIFVEGQGWVLVHCGSCILPMVESPYSPTFQTSPLSSIHSESTILNPVVQIWKSKSESKQTGPKASILPSPLVRLFFLIPGCHSRQSRLLCRFPRVSTTLVTLFISSMVSFRPLQLFHLCNIS